MLMMMSVMKNNNLLYEYAANSATNYKSLYAVINMTIVTDNEHIHTYIYQHIEK